MKAARGNNRARQRLEIEFNEINQREAGPLELAFDGAALHQRRHRADKCLGAIAGVKPI